MPAQWTCPTCFKNFQRKGDLTRHQHLHTGYKPHVCEVCNKAFAQYTGLKTHRNVHTRERPFKCNICSASFSDPSSCARHRRETHANPEGYKCYHPGCKTSIKRRSCFMKHLKQKHGIDHTKIKIETDVYQVPEGLYQISSPESSASPSSSECSVDFAAWESRFVFQEPPVGIVSPKPIACSDGLVLFANSSWASPPCEKSRAIGESPTTHSEDTLSFFSNPQVDLPSPPTIDTAAFFNNLFPSGLGATYEYPPWAGSPLTPPSLCPSLSSSPAPATPEDSPSVSIQEAVAVRYANFIPVQSSKDGHPSNVEYPYALFSFSNDV